ncbi:unnamed protein product, partial [marine sediment metagenome]
NDGLYEGFISIGEYNGYTRIKGANPLPTTRWDLKNQFRIAGLTSWSLACVSLNVTIVNFYVNATLHYSDTPDDYLVDYPFSNMKLGVF